jgi:ubiquinone/menaquinone biosynthesis C-methylase UbiE
MAQHRVCPWWLGYLLASPIRRLWHDPATILGPYVRTGMTVVEPGPGMGFFTLELARLVGSSGHVTVVDIQPKMLDALKSRLAKASLLERVDARLVKSESMGLSDLSDAVDFVLAFAVVHELPSAEHFFREAAQCLKRNGSLLLVEPSGHVTASDFDAELGWAAEAGRHVSERPMIRRSHAALLRRDLR